jgi:hypothetical protein
VALPGTSAPLPNTGPPFPWWMGLLPVSLGIGLLRAMTRRPDRSPPPEKYDEASALAEAGSVDAERPDRPGGAAPRRPPARAGARRP